MDFRNQFKKLNIFTGPKDEKNPLVDRIFDKGIGGKFHEFSNQPAKGKEIKAFLTNFDNLDGLHNDPNYVTNNKIGSESGKATTNAATRDNKTNNKLNKQFHDPQLNVEKINLLNKKFDSRIKEPIIAGIDTEEIEKTEKTIQELQSITGFKTMNKLPPSRGTRNNSVNPMDRLRIVKNQAIEGNTLVFTKTEKISQPLEPKLMRPTTTIIALTKEDTEYIDKATRSKLNNIIKKEQNFITDSSQYTTEEDNILTTINNIMEDKKESQVGDDEDQYMDKINKFIKEAFEGKDYRINFVYYLPSNKENFYELQQTTFDKINKERIYYTLSAKGLTVYIDKKPREFIKLSEWIIERQGYNYVSDINFFKNFKIWRILKIWRKNIFKQKKIAYQNELANNLLFNNKDYNAKICLHRERCNTISKEKILDLRVGLESINFEEFKKKQLDTRKKLRYTLYEIHKKCEDIFVFGIKAIFNDVQKKINAQNNEANYNDEAVSGFKKKKTNPNKTEETKDDDKNEENILSDDNIVGFENYPYKFKMMIKNECLNFIKLAYIFDYIMLDVLRRTYMFSMKDSLRRLDDFNLIEPPKTIRENALNKRDEYVKPVIQNNPNRQIPYFLVKCIMDQKQIENRDKLKMKVKPFYNKATNDDEFDPTAHLQIDPEEEEMMVLAASEGPMVKEDDDKDKKVERREEDIEIEMIDRPHHYFISYDPDPDTLTMTFIKQLDEGINELKVPGWRGHREFSKYLHYLENWDDRYSDWTSGDKREDLNPQEILSLSEDPLFLDRNELVEAAMKIAYKKCDNHLHKLNPYLQLHWKQMKINNNLLLEEALKDSDEMYRLIFHFTEKNIKTLQKWIPFDEEIGMIKLTLEEHLRKDLMAHQMNTINFLKPILPTTLRERAQKIERWISEMYRSIHGNIDSEKQYLEKTKAKDNLDQWFYFYERKLNTIDTIVNIIRSKGFEITADDTKSIDTINSLKYSLKLAWDELNDNLTKNKEKLKHVMMTSSIPSLLKETDRINSLILDEKFVSYDGNTSKSLIPSYIVELESYENMFKIIEKNKKTYNDFLKILGESDYNFDQVQSVHDNLKILKNLWNALKDFDEECDEWKRTKFSEIDTDKILKRIDDYYIHCKKAEMQFGDSGSATKELLTNVNNFKESMQVINDLNSTYLKNYHWERIQNLFDIPKRLDQKDYPLEFLLEIKAYQHQKVINEIALEAKNLELLKIKMSEIVKLRNGIQFNIVVENDTYKTFQKLEEVVEKIEECQSKLNNVLASRYVRLLKEQTGRGDDPYTIKSDLDGSLEMIEDIKIFQSKWRYLNNILNAPGSSVSDIKRKIPDINFDKIDNDWKNIMNKMNDPPIVLIFYNRMKKVHENFFPKNLYQLEQIQLKIEQYLTSMRGMFERFYFISNDDLLYMLSNSSPEKIGEVKPYLSKIFEDIADLLIPRAENSNTVAKEITAIISSCKEELFFEKNSEKRTVKLSEKLEEWLRNLEAMMVNTLKEKMYHGFVYYVDITKDPIGHETWLEKILVSKEGKDSQMKENLYTTENISQVVATVSHVMFCYNTEAAIQMQRVESTSITQWYKKIELAIKTYAKMVNKDFSSGNKHMRRIISNLITHHVHYLEICRNLCVEEPYQIEDFIWQQQLRSYILTSDEKTPVVRIKQLKSDMEYGYEYIGPSTRVVITPLTDRVWLTMTSAIHIKLGCSLGGPAGTGKTETVKDLAKFFGIQCIVFNCSEQIDFKILGNIFSGLCSHKQGAYACLDEFNRINVEVLSVVATQLFTIRQGLLTMLPGESPKQIPILPPNYVELVGKMGVFVTMNPTYSGRTELPDNLKSSFRPITMMVPDFLTIAEVKLYSEGFSESKILAKKLTKLYSLASQQLSQQDHYDFTLRTVGTVLSIAGNLKRQFKSSGMGRERKDEELILLNALRDANFPKFVPQDIQLFKALLIDLFPETDLTEPQLEVFENQVKSIITTDKLHDNNFTVKKCLQLFDILNIRLGICLTGSAGTGKSTCLSLVQKAMTNLRLENYPDQRYKEVVKTCLNPKSITLGELYGQENEDTKTFVFGLATIKIKEALALDTDSNGNKYGWVILDGPIDTKWIENMNSVLDDSMTLCLSNGERIKLKPHVKVIFEVEDLSQASLATVSRLGIVYFGAGELGWRPYFHSWMKKFFPDDSVFTHEMKNYLIQTFEDKMDESIENIDDLYKDGCIFIKPVEVQCCASLCNFLEVYFSKENGFIGRDIPNLDNPDAMSRIKKKIVSIFAFCLLWGVFGCVNNRGFHKIESFVRNKFVEIKMDNSQMIMEHYYDFSKNDFVKYSTDSIPFQYVKDTPFFSIFVPTIDTLRYSSIFDLLIRNQKNVFVTGETGVGKTANLLNVLNKLVTTEEYSYIQINFSAQTSSEDTQRSLESKLEPKTGKKILGAKGGKKLTIFIDDINMPESNEWGAHPPIELLRQYLDQGGFYDRPKFFWKRIEDACMFVCGGPPIGGRSNLSNRFGRHFNIISVPQAGKNVLISIFENILKGFLYENVFNELVRNSFVEATLASIELFEFVCEQMKPIPAKFHYTFNIRDVSKVFQGILMSESKYINSKEIFVKLWAHESIRVFGDRLINDSDLKLLQMQVVNLVKTKFKMQTWTFDSMFKENPLYFGEIQKGDVQERPYTEITKVSELIKKLEYFQEMVNKSNKKNSTELVFFDYAIMHILRITRVLRQPRGNMMLIGHGGNGKQTLTKFAAYTMFCQVTQITQKQYRNDLKEIIKQAGSQRKRTILLLTDNTVTSTSLLEDVNNLLNIGEIPNLYPTSDELQLILNNLSDYMKSQGIPETREKSYETLVEMTRENLHIIFCTSPVGDTLRIRFRKFPALINCCTLNWFINWPHEALVSSCQRLFVEKFPYSESIRDCMVNLSTTAHSDIEELTERYYQELNRRVYVTPKFFLDMVDLFLNLVSTKKGEIDSTITKFEDGVKKLEKTHYKIQILEKELTVLEPEIVVKKAENEIAFERVKTEHAKLDEKTVELSDKSIQVAIVHSNLNRVATKMEYEKTEIMKKLSDTWDEVKENLNKEKLSQAVSGKITSEKRRVIIEAAVVLLKGKKVPTDELGRALSSERERIFSMIEEIENDKISKATMDLFSNYFTVQIPKIFECNTADEKEIDQIVEGQLSEPYKTLYKWGKGCIFCHEQIKTKLKPLKEQRGVIEKEKSDKEQEREALNDDYKKNQEIIQKLQSEQGEIQKTLDDLSNKKEITTRRKNNAGQLIGLLKDEGERWKENLIKLRSDMDNFLGNMFLAAVSISYLCPFTGTYRREQIEKWIYLCTSNNIAVSSDFSLESVLSDPVTVRNWNISGLPSDSVSVQNGTMLFNNPKYALLIDPQLQANQWIKKLNKQKLSVIKGEIDHSNKKQIESLTVDIIKGNTVLVENIGEEIDSLLNPIISKNIFEEGSLYMEFNNQKIEFNPNFQIYFTTKLANPHYSPEYYFKLNIINFTVTFEGLNEQLLSEVFKGERRDKYEMRDGIIESMGRFNQELVKFSKEILQKLADANEELILDDEDLIKTLQNAKSISDVVKEKMRDNVLIENEINMIRDEFIPVAIRGSILYFVIVDLGAIDPMYQFSLEYFKKIFSRSIRKAQQSDNVKERVLILERSITEDIYRNIKRGIFESHKTIFSFLITIYIKRTAKLIEDDEWNLFLKGPIQFDKTDLPENPDRNYFSDFQWDTLLFTEQRYKLYNFCDMVIERLEEFKEFFDNLEEYNGDFIEKFPNNIDSYINSELLSTNNFLKLLLVKIFRPDKVLLFIKKYIKEEIGDFFIDTSPPRLEEIYEESDEKTPIIFILSQGADPTNTFLEFKNRFVIETEEGPRNPRYINISLGQGQEIEASRAILEEGVKNGTWVLLQNCHLFVTWMGELANIVQQLQQDESEEGIHPNFRLWLTSMPNVNFPVSILQNSLKFTTEPPSGVKANIKKIYDEITDQKLNQSQKHPDKFPKIMFTLSLFHSVLQERKKFGPIGFNLRYDFNQADFDTSIQLMSIYLEEADDVPWNSIIYLVGEVNYGGRVTDDFDRVTMMATLNKFLNDRVLEREKDEHGEEIEDGKYIEIKYSNSGRYTAPFYTDIKEYRNYIDTLPIFDEPDLFGLHENANIIYQLQESQKIQNLLLNVIPKSSQSGKSSNEIVLEMVNNLLINKPEIIDKREQKHKSHDKVYENGLPHSLTIVLYQEIEKFNKLINKILISLIDLKKAIEGTISMSSESDEIYNSLLLNKIPNSWAKVGYPSHKPLASWFNDLLVRIEFMRDWMTNGHPSCFWISGMFFPQGFITGVLQNHARETKIPVSDINFKHTVLDKFPEDIQKGPQVGVYIHGLYLEASSWDITTGLLVDQKPGERNFKMPVIWLETVKDEKKKDEDEEDEEENENKIFYYQCPIFKTLKRTGIISASGRSDNYVISIDLPSKENKEFWIMRGSAFICQLDD